MSEMKQCETCRHIYRDGCCEPCDWMPASPWQIALRRLTAGLCAVTRGAEKLLMGDGKGRVQVSEKQADYGDQFNLQVIARGSYIDTATGDGAAYLVEAITVRLNHVALNAWGLSAVMNCRECYLDGEAGDAQWQEYLARQKAGREEWKTEIATSLGIVPYAGSVKIIQAQSEVFVVVHIREI